MGLPRWLGFLRPRSVRIRVPEDAVSELQSYLDEFAKMKDVGTPRLVIDPDRDQDLVNAAYYRDNCAIYPNCELLAKTWGLGEDSRIFWRGLMAHEFGHYLQYLAGRKTTWHDRFFNSLRPFYPHYRLPKEKEAWQLAKELTGLTLEENHRISKELKKKAGDDPMALLLIGDFMGFVRSLRRKFRGEI